MEMENCSYFVEDMCFLVIQYFCHPGKDAVGGGRQQHGD